MCDCQGVERCCLLNDSKMHSRLEAVATQSLSTYQQEKARPICIASMRPAGCSAQHPEASSLASSCALALLSRKLSTLCFVLPCPGLAVICSTAL